MIAKQTLVNPGFGKKTNLSTVFELDLAACCKVRPALAGMRPIECQITKFRNAREIFVVLGNEYTTLRRLHNAV